MNKELTTGQVFAGKRQLGFRLEVASTGSADLQFQKSDGTWATKASYTTDDLIRLDVFDGQNYRWTLSLAKVFREF